MIFDFGLKCYPIRAGIAQKLHSFERFHSLARSSLKIISFNPEQVET